MAELESLIRVRKHQVDEQQKKLAALYESAESLQAKRDQLEAQRSIEREKAKTTDPYLQGFFASYSQEVDRKLKKIDQDRERLEKQIVMAQEGVRAAFEEMKKIEIIDERRKAEIQAEIEKKEADFLDEVAINRFNARDE